jgi:glycosyltransferase involved in cell wall biosynthesis
MNTYLDYLNQISSPKTFLRKTAYIKYNFGKYLKIYNSLKNKTTILPNGLKLNKFKKVSKIDLWKKYNLPQENKIIGFIGRIQYIKGLDISLEILNKIKKEINFTFLIIGPDEGQKSNFQRQAKKL